MVMHLKIKYLMVEKNIFEFQVLITVVSFPPQRGQRGR